MCLCAPTFFNLFTLAATSIGMQRLIGGVHFYRKLFIWMQKNWLCLFFFLLLQNNLQGLVVKAIWVTSLLLQL